MRYPWVFVLSFLMIFFGSYAQEGVEGNLWLSAQYICLKPKAQHFADGGFRSYNYFIRDSRQWLVRYHAQRKLGESCFWLGGGLGFFETHQTPKWNPEFRPFVQFSYIKNMQSDVLRIRYRNEARYFSSTDLLNDRNRLQFWWQHTFSNKRFRLQTAYECFYTFSFEKPWENRWFAGVQIQVAKNSYVTPQYMLLRQQRLPKTNQHTIMFAFIYQLNKQNEVKTEK